MKNSENFYFILFEANLYSYYWSETITNYYKQKIKVKLMFDFIAKSFLRRHYADFKWSFL